MQKSLFTLYKNKRYRQQSIHSMSYFNFSADQMAKFTEIILKSSIINEPLEIDKLFKFFKKNIKSTKLLFKASNYNFSMEKFYDQYGKETNVIIICKTDKNKIIGGYSPFCFYGNGYTKDLEGESFLFSISNNEKIQLQNTFPFPTYQMNHQTKQKMIIFGQHELTICDHADDLAKCYTWNFGKTFFKEGYTDSVQSCKKFNGNFQANFTVKQWQAWQVSFQ